MLQLKSNHIRRRGTWQLAIRLDYKVNYVEGVFIYDSV